MNPAIPHGTVRESADPALGPPLLLRVPQAAARLGVGKSTVEALIASGQLRSLKIGKSRRIPVAALEEFIAARLAEAS
jgi:excisionase family DNA binding protein